MVLIIGSLCGSYLKMGIDHKFGNSINFTIKRRGKSLVFLAFVYHHSNNSEDFKMAYQLGTAAADASSLQEHYQVQWLSKAVFDRWRCKLLRKKKGIYTNYYKINYSYLYNIKDDQIE